MTVLRPAVEWTAEFGICVLDPDGWDRSNFQASWAEPITKAEFARRASVSTASGDFEALLASVEADAAAEILAWRCRKALKGAGELALHVRSLAINGRTERGETLPEWSAPMRITAVDDLDTVYAQLVDWVGFWSEALQQAPPSSAIVAWSAREEVQGFRAGTTPEGASMLVQLLSLWLNVRAEQITAHGSGLAFQQDIVELLGGLRGRYPLAPRPPKPISLRPCPVCGEAAVGADWIPTPLLTADDLPFDKRPYLESMNDKLQLFSVDVRCEHCGFELDVAKPSEIARWLS